jgi:aminopeptidase N
MRQLLTLLIFCFSTTLLFQQTDPHCQKQHAFQNADMMRSIDALDDQNIDIKSYWFDWVVDPNVVFISGSAKLLFVSSIDGLDKIVLSLATKLKVDSIVGKNGKLTFMHNNNYDLLINLDQKLSKGDEAIMTIYYKGIPSNNGFGAYAQGQHSGTKILWTFSVPFGSREWWPCKNGNSDKIDSTHISITTLKEYKAASNGSLIETIAVSNTHNKFVWKHRYPIVPYLIAFAVTNYVSYSDVAVLHDNQKMEVLNFVYPESLTNAKAGTKKLLDALTFYDSLIVRYPFINDKYGHAQFGWGGGMEHQTMSFVTTFDFGLLAHELAHQWFGDMVTCKSWTDVWLNEGFATYMEGLAQERFNPAQWLTWRKTKLANVTSMSGGAVYVNDSFNINRIFDSRLTYDKGAYLLHQLRWLIGDKDFFEGIRAYVNDKKYDFATTKNLQFHLENSSGVSLQEYFNDYFYGEGFPKYDIKWEAKSNNKVSLRISQSQSSNKVSFFEMALPILFSNGSESKLIRLDHNTNNQFYEIDLPFACTKVTFDPAMWLLSRFNVVTETMVSSIDNVDIEDVVVYPNPFKDEFTLKFDHSTFKGKCITIIDITGQMVKSAICTGDAIDCREFPKGNYLLKIQDAQGKELCVKQLVKQ